MGARRVAERNPVIVRGGAAVLGCATAVLAAACGGGSGSTTAALAINGEGIAGRTPPAVSGLASPVAVEGGCVAAYTLQAIGHDPATGAPRLLLTMTLRTSPASEADVASTLNESGCVAQRRDIAARVSAGLPTGGGGGLDIAYRSASGIRLFLP